MGKCIEALGNQAESRDPLHLLPEPSAALFQSLIPQPLPGIKLYTCSLVYCLSLSCDFHQDKIHISYSQMTSWSRTVCDA